MTSQGVGSSQPDRVSELEILEARAGGDRWVRRPDGSRAT
jgi:hypothetical protein